MPIQFKGNTFGSLSTTAVYFIATIVDGAHLTLSTNVYFTNPVTLTDGAGDLAVTAGIGNVRITITLAGAEVINGNHAAVVRGYV